MNQIEPGNETLMLLLAFLGGALIGGTAAVLLAPCSGAETRRRIAGAGTGARDLAARVPQAVRAASGAAQDAFASALKVNGEPCTPDSSS